MKKEIWRERNVKNVINYRKNEIIYTFNNYYQGRRPEGGKQAGDKASSSPQLH